MPYTIDLHEDIISVKFSGCTNHEESIKARDEIIRLNKLKNYYKILADWREPVIETTVTMKNLEEFGNTWPKTHDSRSFVAAIVLERENVDENVRFATDFARVIATKKGLISKSFWDNEEALSWLKNE